MSGNTAKMLNKKKYHYTYLITNKITSMKYFGVRNCVCMPDMDVYMSSSKYKNKLVAKKHHKDRNTDNCKFKQSEGK